MNLITKTHTTTEDKPARRGQPRLPAGTQVTLIQNQHGQTFIWCYCDPGDAAKVVQRLEESIARAADPETELRRLFDFNFAATSDPLHVWKIHWDQLKGHAPSGDKTSS